MSQIWTPDSDKEDKALVARLKQEIVRLVEKCNQQSDAFLNILEQQRHLNKIRLDNLDYWADRAEQLTREAENLRRQIKKMQRGYQRDLKRRYINGHHPSERELYVYYIKNRWTMTRWWVRNGKGLPRFETLTVVEAPLP